MIGMPYMESPPYVFLEIDNCPWPPEGFEGPRPNLKELVEDGAARREFIESECREFGTRLRHHRVNRRGKVIHISATCRRSRRSFVK